MALFKRKGLDQILAGFKTTQVELKEFIEDTERARVAQIEKVEREKEELNRLFEERNQAERALNKVNEFLGG